MDAINYSALRNDLKSYMDRVTEDHEPILVTRKNAPSVVLMSADDYNNLMEHLHIVRNETTLRNFLKAKEQIDQGKLIQPDLFNSGAE